MMIRMYKAAQYQHTQNGKLNKRETLSDDTAAVSSQNIRTKFAYMIPL